MPVPAIRKAHERFVRDVRDAGTNLGLRFDRLGPEFDIRNVDRSENKTATIEVLRSFRMQGELRESYQYAFNAWKQRMSARADVLLFDIEASTKVLLGSGNSSGLEVGVQLNKPWGVPYIRGSSLKGMLSSWLARSGGELWARQANSARKSDAQIELFGGRRESDDTVYAGGADFNDAWLYPYEAHWFEGDIINVHYQKYYAGERFPDGIEDPVPVNMAVLRAGLKFLVTVRCAEAVQSFVKSALCRALAENGIGAKTAVGYGRFRIVKSQEEVSSELREEVRSISTPDELLAFYQANKNRQELRPEIRARCGAVELDKRLVGVYRAVDPLRAILLELREGSIGSCTELGKRWKVYRQNIENYAATLDNEPLRKTGTAQTLFQEVIGRLKPSPAELESSAVLKQIAYRWEDLPVTDERFMNDVLDRKEQQGWLWPPLEDLPAAMRAAGMGHEAINDYCTLLGIEPS